MVGLRFQQLWSYIWQAVSNISGEMNFDGDKKEKGTEHTKVKLGKTLYIVTSHYEGKDNILDKFKRLIIRKLESQSKQN